MLGACACNFAHTLIGTGLQEWDPVLLSASRFRLRHGEKIDWVYKTRHLFKEMVESPSWPPTIVDILGF
jgi:hypothetical protein